MTRPIRWTTGNIGIYELPQAHYGHTCTILYRQSHVEKLWQVARRNLQPITFFWSLDDIHYMVDFNLH